MYQLENFLENNNWKTCFCWSEKFTTVAACLDLERKLKSKNVTIYNPKRRVTYVDLTDALLRRHKQEWSKRYSFFAVGSISLIRGMQIVSTPPALPKALTVPLFSVLRANFPTYGWQSEYYFCRETSRRTYAWLRCVQQGRMLEQVLVHMLWTTPNHQHNTHTSK